MDDSIDDFDDNTGDDDDDDRVDLDLSDCLVCGDAYLRLQLNSGIWRHNHCTAFIPVTCASIFFIPDP